MISSSESRLHRAIVSCTSHHGIDRLLVIEHLPGCASVVSDARRFINTRHGHVVLKFRTSPLSTPPSMGAATRVRCRRKGYYMALAGRSRPEVGRTDPARQRRAGKPAPHAGR